MAALQQPFTVVVAQMFFIQLQRNEFMFTRLLSTRVMMTEQTLGLMSKSEHLKVFKKSHGHKCNVKREFSLKMASYQVTGSFKC